MLTSSKRVSQFDSFRDAGPLGQRHIEIRKSRAIELITSEIAGSVVVRVCESAVADADKGLGGNTGVQRGVLLELNEPLI